MSDVRQRKSAPDAGAPEDKGGEAKDYETRLKEAGKKESKIGKVIKRSIVASVLLVCLAGHVEMQREGQDGRPGGGAGGLAVGS